MKHKILIAAGVVAAAAAPLLAHPEQQGGSANAQSIEHGAMGHSGMAQMNHGQMMSMQNTAANPYAEAEMRMHQRMMPAVGANADETWARKMIEHHRGAVETSQILLSKGSNQRLKDMARRSMAEQQKEISELQAWLKQNGKRSQ